MELKSYNSENGMKNNDDDRKIITRVRGGDIAALNEIIYKYKNIVKAKASPFFIIGAEKEDIIQEGMIGLYKAVQNFDLEKDIAFSTFADLCIRRQIITAIKSSNRQKHIPLNSSLSLNKLAFDEESEKTLMDTLDLDIVPDPLETLTFEETYRNIENTMENVLSDFERQVFNGYINGYSYEQIAQKLNTHVKAVDNAIQRIKKKADKHIIDNDEI